MVNKKDEPTALQYGQHEHRYAEIGAIQLYIPSCIAPAEMDCGEEGRADLSLPWRAIRPEHQGLARPVMMPTRNEGSISSLGELR